MKRLLYYSHRYRDHDPAVQAVNLERAGLRFLAQVARFRGTDTIVWAPWIPLAEAGVPEHLVWPVVKDAIRASTGVIVDFDGGELSEGMQFEAEFAQLEGGKEILAEE